MQLGKKQHLVSRPLKPLVNYRSVIFSYVVYRQNWADFKVMVQIFLILSKGWSYLWDKCTWTHFSTLVKELFSQTVIHVFKYCLSIGTLSFSMQICTLGYTTYARRSMTIRNYFPHIWQGNSKQELLWNYPSVIEAITGQQEQSILLPHLSLVLPQEFLTALWFIIFITSHQLLNCSLRFTEWIL